MNNNQVLKNLVFFEENGKSYFGMRHGGQFIQYNLIGGNNAAYGHGMQTTLVVCGEVFQDSYDDITIDQRKLVAMCIHECLKKVESLNFYSSLYRCSVQFDKNDDIFDIMRKLNEMKLNYGGGKIY